MKILCMHLKIFLCIFALAIVLGIITVTPCPRGQKCSILGRSYSINSERGAELAENAKSFFAKICKKD